MRDVHEHILIFSKDDWKLDNPKQISTVTPKQFAKYTQSIWKMNTANGVPFDHPTPFPKELPKRLIQLYTYVGDTVLDPFLGSGTTCVVAKSLARKSIGYEVNPDYRRTIEARIDDVRVLKVWTPSIKVNGKPLEERLGIPVYDLRLPTRTTPKF